MHSCFGFVQKSPSTRTMSAGHAEALAFAAGGGGATTASCAGSAFTSAGAAATTTSGAGWSGGAISAARWRGLPTATYEIPRMARVATNR